MPYPEIIQLPISSPAGYTQYRMEVPPEFEDVFTHFYFARNQSGTAITKTLLPSFQTMIAFNFGAPGYINTGDLAENTPVDESGQRASDGAIMMGKYALLGPVKKAFSYTLPPGSALFTLNFKRDAFYRFFGQTPGGATTLLNPDLLIGQGCFGQWWQALSGMENLRERVQYMLESCRSYIGKPDARIKLALSQEMEEGQLTVDPIKNMSANAKQSIRNMQLQFQKQLGYSAKAYLRNQRFMEAILMIQKAVDKGEKPDWFAIIADCHYYDQSQLIRDFNFFMELTPTKYLQLQEAICYTPKNASSNQS